MQHDVVVGLSQAGQVRVWALVLAVVDQHGQHEQPQRPVRISQLFVAKKLSLAVAAMEEKT